MAHGWVSSTRLRAVPLANVVTISSPGCSCGRVAHGAAVGGAGDAPAAGHGVHGVEQAHPFGDGIEMAQLGLEPLRRAPHRGRGDRERACRHARPLGRRRPAPAGRAATSRSSAALARRRRPGGGCRGPPRPRRWRRGCSAALGPCARWPSTPARCAAGTRCTCSTSAAAQAVGVFSALCATSSATLRSISWPSPVNTGSGDSGDGGGDGLVVERGQLAAAAAAADDDDRIEVAVASRACAAPAVTSVTAHSPCTRTSTTRSWNARRAALDLVQEVGPGRAGDAGDHARPAAAPAARGAACCGRTARPRPAGARTSSRCSASSPSVKRGSMPLIFRPS